MKITIEKLMQGKAIQIKDKSFATPATYVGPFLEELGRFTTKFNIEVQLADQYTRTGDIPDLAYNKVWVQAVLPDDYNIGDYQETYNIAYALDVKKPHFKVFRCYKHKQDGTLMAFNTNWIVYGDLPQSVAPQYSLQSLMETFNDIEAQTARLSTTTISENVSDRQAFLGKLIDRALVFSKKTPGGLVKLAAKDIINAYKIIYGEPTSQYFTADGSSDLLNWYQALAATNIDDKDFINAFEKTILVSSLIGD